MIFLGFWVFLCYNEYMRTFDLTSLSPEITAYITSLETQVQDLKVHVDRLTNILTNFQKAMYGQSSEKRKYVLGQDENQPSLFNEAEAEADRNAPEPKTITVSGHVRKNKRTKEELASNVPVTEILCELDEKKRVCGECGGKMRILGKEIVREELEFIPAQTRLLRYVRENYVCASCEKETGKATIIKAPVPAPVIKKSLASPSSVAYTMYQKYVNAMPLYRQEKDWENQGIALSRATLANWIIRTAADWLEPLWEKMKSYLLKEPVVHADETVIQVLKEQGKKPSSESRMWVYCSGNTGNPPIIIYEYQPTRSGEHARRFLQGFSGYLQTDGYSGYDKVQNVTRCGCWAHLKRKYQEALPRSGDIRGSTAAIGFEYCNQLFAIEKDLSKITPEKRKLKRQEQSKPIFEAYLSWLETVNPLQGSKLAEAITYSLNQKASLGVFLEDGRIELSNNRAENAIRPFVVGRKSWLFADTTKGARASAVVYSIVETAKANKLNIFKYLVHIFRTMPALDFKNCPWLLENLMPWSENLPDYCYKEKLLT